ncbi:MAG: dUTP diphosphatase [Candidatus Woesearchaeota archaeon]
MRVRIKLLHKEAKIPQYAHKGDSGVDLYSIENIVIKHGEWQLVRTGVSIEIPSGYEAQIRPRSGLALKHGISVLNTPGTIDSGYRGEIGVILVNHSRHDFLVEKHTKIAQMVFCKVERVSFQQVDKLKETTRNKGGFGSTGK